MTQSPGRRARGLLCAMGAAATAAMLVSFLPGAAPGLSAQSGGQPSGSTGSWVTAWATSQQTLGQATVSNASVRLIARVTVPGETIRVRLDNAFGTEPLRIGRAHVGYRVQGAAVAKGSNKPLTFDQAAEVTVPPGGTVWSDPVSLPVFAQQDLAISLYVPGSSIRPSQHSGAYATSYRSADGTGDTTADETRTPWTATFTNTWWLKAVDVQSASSNGTIVAFGDSITDGTCSTVDANDRWVNVLSERLGLQYDAAVRAGARGARLKALVNEGIGGNTVTREGLKPAVDSPPGVERLERDVLSHHGVTDVIFFMGTNDLRRDAPIEQVQKGIATVVERIHAKKWRVIGVTIIPRHNAAPNGTNTGWDPEKTTRRNAMNQWLKTKAGFDALIDFDATIRDPKQPDMMLPAYGCGDGIHPSPLGYYALGRSIPLSLFGPGEH